MLTHVCMICSVSKPCLSSKIFRYYNMIMIPQKFCPAKNTHCNIFRPGNEAIAVTKYRIYCTHLLCDIIDNNCSLCTMVVHWSYTLIPFLSCCVPYSKLHFCVVIDYCLRYEVNWKRDCRIVTAEEWKRRGGMKGENLDNLILSLNY